VSKSDSPGAILRRQCGGWKTADLAARFDTKLKEPAFWEGSLKIIEGRIDRYVAL
jgi:oligoendopeptidase F